MEKILNEVINSIPEFMKKVNEENTFATYTKEVVVYAGVIDPHILKEWWDIANKKKIPFIRNKLYSPYYDDVNVYRNSTKGYIFVTMEYSTSNTKPYLSWGFRTAYDENPLRYNI